METKRHRDQEDTYTHGEKGHVEFKADWNYASINQGMSGATTKLKEARKESFQEALNDMVLLTDNFRLLDSTNVRE